MQTQQHTGQLIRWWRDLCPGGAYNPGDSVLVYKSKMYSADSILHYSALNDVTEWTDGSLDAGFINFSNNAGF